MGNVLYVNKPKGISSFDVCFRLRKVLGTKKIGHTGTLDPNATGVMIILFNKATKANQFLVTDKKEYICKVKLGIRTDTLDIDGNIIEESSYTVPEKETISETLKSFLGKSIQEVPLTSAVSVEGKRLYQYQREGKEVELPKREIEVSDIKLLDIFEDGFSFRSTVSSGTYIRALVRDILMKLNQIGTVSELERTAVDEVRIENCDNLEEIEKGNYKLHEIGDLLIKRYKTVEYPERNDILNGKKLKLNSDEKTVLVTNNDEVLAVYEKDGDIYRSLRGLW
ncbi:MAG: tRNA pseudouridine(55) synthase TruB [Erysipelotrichaceae bacterium]|nr:tRNA pseudouridine(55) synthase TruB [Erysipelotrichaceae bacterium]